MDRGQLFCTYLKEYTEKRRTADGITVDYNVTEEEQAERLSDEWIPVDFINDEIIRSAKHGEVIVPVPYDAGDHIAYRYERRYDTQGVRAEIQNLKDRLSQSDYKITKCYEASLLGQELPYDINALHEDRQAQRDKINELEARLEDIPQNVIII